MDLFDFEEEAAHVVAGLNGKRERDDSPDAAGGYSPDAAGGPRPLKTQRMDDPVVDEVPMVLSPAPAPVPLVVETANPVVADLTEVNNDVDKMSEDGDMLPAPFFGYKDHSTEPDPDALSPLTPPGRVPNFPAKMHAILSRPDLTDIICWMPHGRSWRVLKPREFEVRVIPTYFEHAKFSSFIRQANGWGFRRITQGKDRNSYYNPLFLRGLPHLCKKMKRPGVAQKIASDPDHEPDLYKISEMHPVPSEYTDESVLLQCTLEGGPKARMPIYTGLNKGGPKFSDFKASGTESKQAVAASMTAAPVTQLTPHDNEALSAFQKSLGASETEVKKVSTPTPQPGPAPLSMPQPQMFQPQCMFGTAHMANPFALPMNSNAAGANKMSTLAAANQLAFSNPMMANPMMNMANAMGNPSMNMAAAFQASTAASQFAAGFAAATMMSQQQFRAMFETFSAGMKGSHMQASNHSQVNSPPATPAPPTTPGAAPAN